MIAGSSVVQGVFLDKSVLEVLQECYHDNNPPLRTCFAFSWFTEGGGGRNNKPRGWGRTR